MMLNWLSAMSEAVEVVAVETAAAANPLVELPLLTKGLLTSAVGLLGVFLVLTLFLVTIKGMQSIKTKNEEN